MAKPPSPAALDGSSGTGSAYYGRKFADMLDKQRPKQRAPAMWDDELRAGAREFAVNVLVFIWGFLIGAGVMLWTR